MGEFKVPLEHGYKLGKDILMNAYIRPYTPADLMAAEEESEKLITTSNADGEIEHKLVLSPALYGRNIFRRQIVRMDDISGPFTIDELTENLHMDDFVLLQQKTEALDEASIAKTTTKKKTEQGKS